MYRVKGLKNAEFLLLFIIKNPNRLAKIRIHNYKSNLLFNYRKYTCDMVEILIDSNLYYLNKSSYLIAQNLFRFIKKRHDCTDEFFY